MQRGGIQLKNEYNEEDALKYFIENSIITALSTNSVRSILLLTLIEGIETSYSTIRQGNVKDVRKMILKIVITRSEEEEKEFNNEVDIQQRLFEATHHTKMNETEDLYEDYSEAVCPCIILYIQVFMVKHVTMENLSKMKWNMRLI